MAIRSSFLELGTRSLQGEAAHNDDDDNMSSF